MFSTLLTAGHLGLGAINTFIYGQRNELKFWWAITFPFEILFCFFFLSKKETTSIFFKWIPSTSDSMADPGTDEAMKM